jgi:hypothetical protein
VCDAPGDGGADAGGATGHDGRLAVERLGHGLSSPGRPRGTPIGLVSGATMNVRECAHGGEPARHDAARTSPGYTDWTPVSANTMIRYENGVAGRRTRR